MSGNRIVDWSSAVRSSTVKVTEVMVNRKRIFEQAQMVNPYRAACRATQSYCAGSQKVNKILSFALKSTRGSFDRGLRSCGVVGNIRVSSRGSRATHHKPV